ncbi:hypothetical protein ENSA5_41630 [Enhygromyxa salina]|uniref:Cytochrome c domain-containing protein n=1 Tax=Enhygromyxa salina TaxID=215803 RepID=A0A2S9XMY3_9BACT|nr:hypothetical protein [Enhygromyxa salina]PRP94051.1 hypothetical protein ENSA5_41630 [Enhygromyxa salina]
MTMACLRSCALLSTCVIGLTLSACASDSPSDGETEADTGDDQAEAEAEGDGDGDPGDGDGDESALRPNWHEDIAPLVYTNCVGCHAEGGIAPFALETYEQASVWGALASDAVNEGVMPPWGAIETEECQPEHDWTNDLRLAEADRQLLADWVAAGTPEGDPADAVALPSPPELALQDPSASFQNPSPFVVGGTEDSFICYSIDPQLATDVWVTGVQMIPDNEQVVHHVLIYADPDANSAEVAGPDGSYPCFGTAGVNNASLIGTWVPGSVPTEMPEDVGVPMRAGSRVILAYHYHPTGAGDEVDQSSVALRWVEDKPAYEATIDLLGNFVSAPGLEPGPNDPDDTPLFMIPPDVADHTETMSVTIPDGVPPIDIVTLGTHMHYIGVDMKVWIEREGEEICLIQTPRWDFNWQRTYNPDAELGAYPKVQGGDVVKLRCTYDNTLANPFLVQALDEQGLSEPTTVFMGEASLDEMCLLIFGLATPFPLP